LIKYEKYQYLETGDRNRSFFVDFFFGIYLSGLLYRLTLEFEVESEINLLS
jgi:hypothetical protein